MRIDMHVHTRHSSDCFTPVGEVIKAAKRRGLDGIAITDHSTTAGVTEAKKIAGIKDFLIIPAEEAKIVESGRKIGELLVYFTNKTIAPGTAGEVFDQARSQGAFTSVAHPFGHYWADRREATRFARKADAVEILNGRTLFDSLNRKACELARKLGKCVTAGSDAHFPSEIGSAFAEAEAGSLSEFRKKLEKKEVRVIGRRGFPLPMVLATALKKRVNL